MYMQESKPLPSCLTPSNTIINPDQTPSSLMTVATLQMVTKKRPQKSKWKE